MSLRTDDALEAEPVGEAGRPDLPLVCARGARGPPRGGLPPARTVSRPARALRARGADVSGGGAVGCDARWARSACGCRRARERLRVRLTRRGLAPTAGLLGALLGAGGASAWLPATLVSTTVRAATRFAASEAAATGLVSASVVALTKAVLRTMALARLKAGDEAGARPRH